MSMFALSDPSQTFKLGLIYYPVIFIVFILGVIVYLSNTKHNANKWFLATTVSFSSWMFVRYLSDFDELQETVFVDKFAVSISVLIGTTFFYFAANYIRQTRLPLYVHIILNIFPLFTFFFAGTTNWYIKRLYYSDLVAYRLAIEVTPLYVLNTLNIAFLCISGLVLIFLKSRKSEQDKKQAKYVYVGLLSALIINVLNDFYLIGSKSDVPGIQHAVISAAGVLIFATVISYGMLRKGLFDFKEAVLRLVGYSISILTLALVYGIVLYFSTGSIFSAEVEHKSILLGILLSVLTAFTFPYVKHFYDKFSRNYFFRNTYVPTQVLQELNHIFISKVEVDSLIDQSLTTIVQAICPQFGLMFATMDSKILAQSRKGITAPLPKLNLDTDYLENAPWNGKNTLVINDPQNTDDVTAYLTQKHTEVLIRLQNKDEYVGYLILGAKQNGTKYNKKDVEFLGTVGDNLSLAIYSARQFATIQDFNETLTHKIKEATTELRASNRQLVKLSNAKDDMISMVSHQLIPQLSAAKGFLDLAKKDAKHTDELLDLGVTSINRMTSLAQSMLNSTRIQVGELELHKRSVDVVELVKYEILNLKYAAKKHKVRVVLESSGQVILEVDEGKFKEAVFNIVDNAIQYSPPGSEVKITISPNSLSVRDHGIGIPVKEQKQLFNKFFRASNAKDKRPNGTGIGLYVAKKIIEAHGYNLDVESEEGLGTKIIIRLYDKAGMR